MYARSLWMTTVVLSVSLMSVGTSQAGLLPVSVSVQPEASSFRWTYAIVLPTDSQLKVGNYFTIYDFSGFVPGTNSQPSGWTFSMQNKGPTPDTVEPDDDPSLPNLHWHYTGEGITNGQVGLGNFWAISQFDLSRDSFFTARTNRVSDGRIDTNITTTSVPVPQGPGPVIPEPGTLVLAGLGLPVIALFGRLRRSRQA
jgi:hypothetical protein